MITIFNDGSHVRETFTSDFKTIVNSLALTNAPVSFRLNQQDNESIELNCEHAFACDYINFIHALYAEIMTHGVAIVIALDCRTDAQDNTVFVVCDDEL